MSRNNRVAVLFSEQTRQRLITEAKSNNAIYKFQTSDGSLQWLKGKYAYLKVNGCMSILRRLGIKADEVDEGKLSGYRVVFTPDSLYIDGKEILCFPPRLFEHIGGLLQGQINFESLRRSLGRSDFYLDNLACRIKERLERESGLLDDVRYPWGNHSNVLVVRHDTDFSKNTKYLDYEIKNGVPATYAILQRGSKFWIEQIKAHKELIEKSWHWHSLGSIPLLTSNRPNKGKSTKEGISVQIAEGYKSIADMETAHKHGDAFYYPESIYANDIVYEKHPKLLGMGNMFCYHMIKWDETPMCKEEYVVQNPHVSVPFWYPYHLAISSVEKYKILRGWDISMFMEPTPDVINRMFDNARELPGGVYMVGYHPSRAKRNMNSREDPFEWYKYLVERARDEGWMIATYRDVLKRLNEWENDE